MQASTNANLDTLNRIHGYMLGDYTSAPAIMLTPRLAFWRPSYTPGAKKSKFNGITAPDGPQTANPQHSHKRPGLAVRADLPSLRRQSAAKTRREPSHRLPPSIRRTTVMIAYLQQHTAEWRRPHGLHPSSPVYTVTSRSRAVNPQDCCNCPVIVLVTASSQMVQASPLGTVPAHIHRAAQSSRD
ncbi:hypothetical protein PtA15_14A328 [Puccinia triticina]|uniref:Uncharacterized protein n=1 Tax=Puccinia triticina TaxID=208348 RepID=A0ABY7D1I9_9BASI|nr:uncharacterized protein PtA15_14A328 [Puccinia triticina]WAQ91444.1 hypothetical protein PtA15_14A328 [Puccinia triticina]